MKNIKHIFLGSIIITLLFIGGIAHADVLGFGPTTLRLGSSGQYVANLQTVLNDFEHASLVIDGKFGPNTKSALQAFQASNSLFPDGLAGNLTKETLFNIQSGSSSVAIPSIQSLSPSSGTVGTAVTIYGSGFVSGENTVLFNGGPVTASWNSGSSISFVVPDSVGADCQGNSVCPMYEQLITAGTYSVSVRNSNGTSNTLYFTVTSNPITITNPYSVTSGACSPVPITTIVSGVPQTTTGIPILEVTSPGTGSTYPVGDTIPITWTNCGTYQGNVTISLVGQGTSGLVLANNIPITNGSYQYVIPAGNNLGGQYTIVISDGALGDSNSDQGSSGSFTIVPNSNPTTTQQNWIYSATAPQGFDQPNSGIVGSAPYYVIFRQNPSTLYSVWTKNQVPGTDSNGNEYYGASTTLAQMSLEQSVVASFQQQVTNYFASSQKNYLVASLFIDGGPQYQTWSITNY